MQVMRCHVLSFSHIRLQTARHLTGAAARRMPVAASLLPLKLKMRSAISNRQCHLRFRQLWRARQLPAGSLLLVAAVLPAAAVKAAAAAGQSPHSPPARLECPASCIGAAAAGGCSRSGTVFRLPSKKACQTVHGMSKGDPMGIGKSMRVPDDRQVGCAGLPSERHQEMLAKAQMQPLPVSNRVSRHAVSSV